VKIAAFAAAVFLAGAASSAAAQSVEDARRLYLDADFQGSADAFAAVLTRPSVDALEAAESHRYLVLLRHLLEDGPGARRHAAAAVALDPGVEAPEGSPPDVQQLLDRAREESGGQRAAITIAADGPARSGENVRVRATLAPAPEALATTMSLRCVSGSANAEERGAPPEVRLEIELDGDTILCRASAGPAGGAALVTARVEIEEGEGEEQPGTGAGTGAGTGPEADSGEGGGLPWLWIGVGAGAVAVAVLAVVLLGGSDGASLGGPRVEW
jgi:hypothetical protein